LSGELDRTSVGADALIDAGKAQTWIDERAKNPLRIKVGTFHLPFDASKAVKRNVFYTNAEAFISAMSRQGWKLESRVQFKGPFPATEFGTNIPLLEMREWRVVATFKHMDSLKITRIELPPELQKLAPDHTAPVVTGAREVVKHNPNLIKEALNGNS